MTAVRDPDELIDVTPALRKWATIVECAEIELASTSRLRWFKRMVLREKIRVYRDAIGLVTQAALLP